MHAIYCMQKLLNNYAKNITEYYNFVFSYIKCIIINNTTYYFSIVIHNTSINIVISL